MSFSPDNVHETGVWPQRTLRISVETAEAQLAERLEKTWSRARSEFLYPSGVVTPFGGVALLLGWLALLIAIVTA